MQYINTVAIIIPNTTQPTLFDKLPLIAFEQRITMSPLIPKVLTKKATLYTFDSLRNHRQRKINRRVYVKNLKQGIGPNKCVTQEAYSKRKILMNGTFVHKLLYGEIAIVLILVSHETTFTKNGMDHRVIPTTNAGKNIGKHRKINRTVNPSHR